VGVGVTVGVGVADGVELGVEVGVGAGIGVGVAVGDCRWHWQRKKAANPSVAVFIPIRAKSAGICIGNCTSYGGACR
jgi:hypothetical protein